MKKEIVCAAKETKKVIKKYVKETLSGKEFLDYLSANYEKLPVVTMSQITASNIA